MGDVIVWNFVGVWGNGNGNGGGDFFWYGVVRFGLGVVIWSLGV